ncbi:hypothetical protein [Frankia sp. AgB32]|uniref:hypothetical protein n=1 Tax=Frankia sp. AgB32 TaxID=631119 RepID=UPI00200BC391|nr:hypothetical protein [Frankia sp. AgB32]MCK9897829.1 hypothetical protein [Frankia sp. AgB32]
MLPQLRHAVDSGQLPAELARGTERVLARLPALCGPDPAPALPHGDAQPPRSARSCSARTRRSSRVDAGFPGRRELWRLRAYFAVIAVAGSTVFGRSFLSRLAAAVRQYT